MYSIDDTAKADSASRKKSQLIRAFRTVRKKKIVCRFVLRVEQQRMHQQLQKSVLNDSTIDRKKTNRKSGQNTF